MNVVGKNIMEGWRLHFQRQVCTAFVNRGAIVQSQTCVLINEYFIRKLSQTVVNVSSLDVGYLTCLLFLATHEVIMDL